MITLDKFIGHTDIVLRLRSICEQDDNYSILLRGPYGHGKTTLAKGLGIWYAKNKVRLVDAASGIPFNSMVADTAGVYTPNLWVIDEVHKTRNFERLYPLMGKLNTIFCTNLGTHLPESFISRCYEFRLGDYSTIELTKIIMINTNAKMEVAQYVSTRCKDNPRIGINLTKKFLMLCNQYNISAVVKTVSLYFNNSLHIDDLGLDNIDKQILKTVSTGPCSKNTLCQGLRISEGELLHREEFLIRQQLITIASNGRNITGKGELLCK